MNTRAQGILTSFKWLKKKHGDFTMARIDFRDEGIYVTDYAQIVEKLKMELAEEIVNESDK